MPGPHEIAADVIVGLHEFLELLGLDAVVAGTLAEDRRLVIEPVRARARRRAPGLSVPMNLRFGIVVAIDAVELLPAVAPAIDIVVADDIELFEKRGQCRLRLGRDVVAGDGDRPGRILRAENVESVCSVSGPLGSVWSGTSLPALHKHDGRMVAVAQDHVGQVAHRPFVEILGGSRRPVSGLWAGAIRRTPRP